MDGLEESERARERQNESARERERERTMFEPEQGSKLQPAEMVVHKTKEKPAPVWFRQGRVFSLVSDLHISLGESGHT